LKVWKVAAAELAACRQMMPAAQAVAFMTGGSIPTAEPLSGSRKERKVFFFEKKQQKTFICFGFGLSG
jgi:hypothetical protein